jgi:hypothetical protein
MFPVKRKAPITMLNDNVVPFTPKPKFRLTVEQQEYLEDMYHDIGLTFDNIQEQFGQSEFAHGMIVILLDSEGQVYVDACGTDKMVNKMKKLSTWMEAFNDLHNEGDSADEVLS